MKNFFNAIGVADMEKVHSAMIAWILDDANDTAVSASASYRSMFSTFPQNVRSELLCDMFGVSPKKTFKYIKTHIEWNDIDIMIKTEDGNGTEEVWVIENKLKSQEHLSNETDVSGKEVQIWQTEKYEKIIKSTFSNCLQHYMLLSLGGDKAQSTSGQWVPYTYEKLFLFLSKVANIQKYTLIEEYTNAIGLIVSELDKFLKSMNFNKEYPNVFVKRSKAVKAIKQQQNSITPEETFIIENGLETIFQKQFLAKMVHDNLPQISNDVHYDERNGIAMFILPISKINDFNLNIEFQGGAYKVGILHENYINKGSGIHTHRLYGEKTGTGAPYLLFMTLAQNNWRIALSKNLGSSSAKPRIALDKNIGRDWYNNPKNKFITVFQEAKALADKIKKSLPNIS